MSQKAGAPSSDPSARHELQLVLATFLIFLVLLQCETLDFRNVMAWISEYSIRKKLEKPIFFQKSAYFSEICIGTGPACAWRHGKLLRKQVADADECIRDTSACSAAAAAGPSQTGGSTRNVCIESENIYPGPADCSS